MNDGNGGNNYLVTFHSVSTGTIAPRTLVVTASGMNKIYDGATVATVTLSDDRLSGDTFTDSYAAASFANKNVGIGKAMSVTGISLSGTDAGDYTPNTTASATANISKRALTVSATGISKQYDGNPTASVTLSTDAIAVFDEFGFREHLTPQRSNGLRSMVERIRADARETLATAS